MTALEAERSAPLHARVAACDPVALGDEASVAALAGDSAVTVGDGSDFDEDGGSCLIGGTVYTYASVTYIGDAADDGDPAVLGGLSPVLAAPVAVGDRVDVWEPLAGAVSIEYVATLAVDAADIGGDPPEAAVDHTLAPFLINGIRERGFESVELDRDGDDLRVMRILGKPAVIDPAHVGAVQTQGYLPADVSVADDTWTTVAWTVTSDDSIEYDSATKRFRVLSAGKFLIIATGCWTNNGTGSRGWQFLYDLLDGTTVTDVENQVQAVTGGASRTVHDCTRARFLQAGEYVSAQVRQKSGAALNLIATDTKLTIDRIG